ncbi:MAG: STAS/SEC14 domain-containing protein [Bacteroidota bacterium]
MPVTYRFDSTIIVVEMTGKYSMNTLRTTILDSLIDSQGPDKPFLLFNFDESRSIFIRSSEDINIMANFISSLANRFGNRLAFVSSYELPYGLMRFVSVKSVACGIEAEVFWTYDEAREWLLS